MVLISSSPTQADAKSTLFNLGDNLTRTAELHVKLRLQRRNKSKDLLFERIDAIRSNDELILQLNSNQAVQIKDYFTACVVGDCLVEILQDNNTDDESSYFSLPADSVGLDLSNDTQLMLALGGDTDLLQISKNQVLTKNIVTTEIDNHLDSENLFHKIKLDQETEADNLAVSKVIIIFPLLTIGFLTYFLLSSSGKTDKDVRASNSIIEDIIVRGNIDAGPILTGDGLSVVAYNKNGFELKRSHIEADGFYELLLDTSARGNVMFRVIDGNGNAPDYIDETSRHAKDISADLRSLIYIDKAGEYSVNINPLTELMVRKLGLHGGDNGDSNVDSSSITINEMVDTNEIIANAIGLTGKDIVNDNPVLSVTKNGSSNLNINDYGVILASISGIEFLRDESTDDVLNYLLSQFSTDDKLSEESKSNLLAGNLLSGLDSDALADNLNYGATNELLVVILNYIDNPLIYAAAIQSQYHAAGLFGVTENNISEVNRQLLTVNADAVNTIKELNVLIINVALNTIKASINNLVVLSVKDYLAAGILGVTANNINEINTIIRSSSADDVSTRSQIQAFVNEPVSGDVIIQGALIEGEVLSAKTNDLNDINGLGQFSYQWRAGAVEIDKATSPSYTLTPLEVGKEISVVVSYNDGLGFADSKKSAATQLISPIISLSINTNTNVDETNTYTSEAATIVGRPVGIVTYSLEGIDAGLFNVDARSGVVSMVAQNYEDAKDSGADNVYNYTLKATDSDGNSATHSVVVTVADVTETSTLTLGGISNSFVDENAVYSSGTPTLSGIAIGTVTYRLEGDDASLFTVASNGVVSLRVAQNYESPADTGSDNVYNYTLRVTDSDTNTAVIDVVVTVANIPPQIAYHSLSWGNVLSAVEQLTNGSINVLLTTAEDGDEVEFEVEGKVFSGQTINGSAEIEIPIDDIKLFSEGVLNYKLTVSDKWGSSSHESDKFTVDSSEPIRPEGIIERESYIIGESVLHELTANDETISVLEYGVIANADYDQTAKLEEAFRLANQAGKVLIFPDGTYLINSDIVVTKFDFRAENRYQVTFKNTSSEDVRIGGQRWEGKSTEGRIHGVIFDRVDLEFYGRTEPVKILDNIFRNSNIYVAHDAHQVIGNIFFNDDQLKHNAFAITSYKSKDLLVANNIIGSSSQKAEFHTNTYLSEDVVTQIKNEFNFDIYNQTSNYTTGIHNISDDLNASHLNNIIISEKTGGYFRDHANYSKAYVNLLYEGNYVSGWPPNGAGGMKFRNADGGLILRGNFLDDTNILTYAYDHHHTHLKLNDTFIYDNVIKAGPTFHIGDIGYWENSAVDITVDGYFIFNNHFVTDQPRINLAWRNSVGDDFKRIAYYDNTYEGDLIFTEFNNTNVPIETLKAKGNSLLDDEYPYLNEAYTNDNAVNRSRIYGLLEDDKEAGAQFIQLNESADTPILSVGNDTVFSGQGNDYLSGLDGNDRLISGLGDDHLYGGQGNDLLDGGAGSDILHGDSGYDLLFGRDGDDTLQGGYGNDILYGGLGDDYLSGGDGQDIFIFTNLMDGHDTISDFTLAARDNINNIIDGGDVMDFSSLLEGATYNTLSQYITISNDQGNIKLDVDYDGQAGANNTLVNITLLGISYLDHYATFLNEAINSGEINIV